MNLLSLVGPRLDNIYQIRRKCYYSSGWNFFQSKQGLHLKLIRAFHSTISFVIHLFFLQIKNNSEPHTEVCNRKAAVATSADWVNIAVNKWQVLCLCIIVGENNISYKLVWRIAMWLTRGVCLSLWQSFVIAVIVIVAATFSTGIDSKCLQVRALDSHLSWRLNQSYLKVWALKRMARTNKQTRSSSRRRGSRRRTTSPTASASSTWCSPWAPCTSPWSSSAGTRATPWRGKWGQISEGRTGEDRKTHSLWI